MSFRKRAPALVAAAAAVALTAAAAPASADPPDYTSFSTQAFSPPLMSPLVTPLLAAPGACVPGTQVACQCGGGRRGAQTCEPTGIRFSACVCAKVDVDVNVKVPVPPIPPVPRLPSVDVSWRKPRPRPPGKRYSGLGFFIAGGAALTNGTTGLVWGIERLGETRNDPFGIVLIATGGTAMAAGLPLFIVGLALLGSRGLHPEQPRSSLTLTPTASGWALAF